MNSNDHPSIREQILAKIERNEVQMHSRAYFSIKLAVVLFIALLVLLMTVFIGNFVFFILRLNGHTELLSLGSRGLEIFIQVFPWWLLGLDIALSASLVWLVRHFQFGYRTPVISIFFALVALAFIAGFALDKGTSLNDHLLDNADKGLLPKPFDSVYTGARRPPPNGSAYRGVVSEVKTESITLIDPDFPEPRIIRVSEHVIERGFSVTVGQTVFVIGREENGVITAYEIHPINAMGLPPRHHVDDGDKDN